MESDRKSGLSSYYGGRGSTGDALNQDFPSANFREERPRYDSSSTFYSPDPGSRQSTELLNGKRSAGYNRKSFFDAGRVEPLKGGYDDEEQLSGKDEGNWDVFADFNNSGPRYSTAFGQNEAAYQPISHPRGKNDDAASSISPVEMVTVPALGPEWKASELHNMTKSAKREQKSEAQQQWWKEWTRGERGLCGMYFTKRFTVFFIFALCVAAGIILAFTIPRVPSFTISENTPLLTATGTWNASMPTSFSRAPANFSFPAYADLEVDATSNFLPLKFTHLNAQVLDLDSNAQVGLGNVYSHTVPGKVFTRLLLPLNFTYVATNDSDTTWTNWYNACKNAALYANDTRPGLRFNLILNMKIYGLVGSYQTSTVVTSGTCPIELSVNSA